MHSITGLAIDPALGFYFLFFIITYHIPLLAGDMLCNGRSIHRLDPGKGIIFNGKVAVNTDWTWIPSIPDRTETLLLCAEGVISTLPIFIKQYTCLCAMASSSA